MKNSKDGILNNLLNIVAVGCVLALILSAIVGHILVNNEYTEYSEALLYNKSETPYLYSRGIGAEIGEGTKYQYTYEYIVEDTSYYIHLQSTKSVDALDLKIRYSNKDPKRVQFDYNSLYNISDEPNWVMYNK